MKKREFITPDLTPLIDIVFLLLVFFLVSSALKKDELALLLNLPQTQAAEIKVEELSEELTVELSNDLLAFNNTVMTFEELEKLLTVLRHKERMVNIRIDEDVLYKRIVRLLDILKKHNLENIALINEKAPTPNKEAKQ